MDKLERRRSHTITAESDRNLTRDRRTLRHSFSKESTLSSRSSLPPGLQQNGSISFFIRNSFLGSPSTGKSWMKFFSGHSSKQ